MARALIVDYTPQIVQLVRAIICTMNDVKHVVPHGEERLLAHVAREHPSISSKLIVVTAPPIARAVLRVEAVRPRAMIEKPFDVLAFATAVRAILPPPETRHIATQYAA